MTIHLGRPLPDASRDLPEERCENAPVVRSHRSFLFGLAPGGVYRAAPVSRRAVRSYRTLSPLPVGFATNWRFAFCGTFPGVAPAGRYPAPCFRGARTFLPLQVSHSKARSSSRLTRNHYTGETVDCESSYAMRVTFVGAVCVRRSGHNSGFATRPGMTVCVSRGRIGNEDTSPHPVIPGWAKPEPGIKA